MQFPPSTLLLVFPLLSLTPSIAQACGGTFCDGGTQMAVDQTGEDILFIREGNEVEVHVRIAYSGEAERFAWLVPLQAVPDISVGSEPLFAELSQTTAPRWFANRTYECEGDNPNWGGGFIPESDVASASEPDVVLTATVGAFDIVVLQGGTAGEVIDFLQANDYLQDPESEPILQEYLDEGFLFAAAKLSAGVGTDSIHPLVFRMPADEFCVPIRLTRIAAQQDMGIRAYFLGTARAVPSNYQHVVLNPLGFDWSSDAASLERYVELLSLAVDEAGGKAFATDYAGTSEMLSAFDVYSSAWDEAPFASATPITAIDLIGQQGLATHPLIQPLLMQYVPPPDGLDPQDFWNDIESYADLIDDAAWDGPAFAAAIAEQIIEPGLHASDLIETWPYLTRLHTTMSPAEMTLDPTFHTNPDLPDVDNALVTSSQVACGLAEEVYAIPVGAQTVEVCVPNAGDFPSIEGMPAALRVEQLPMAGPPQVIADEQALALELLAAQQAMVACETDMGESGGSSSGDSGEGGSGSGLTAGNDESSEAGLDAASSGCGCTSEPDSGRWALALGLVVLAHVRPRGRGVRR
jgi:MYXO-CTERM domain-containing protein